MPIITRSRQSSICGAVAQSLVLAAFACAPLAGEVDPPVRRPSAGLLVAGAAKLDITPVPGFSLGGHSIDAGTGLGTWLRLYARTIYFEDAQGTPLVLVACELWAMPSGLADRVAELVQTDPALQHIGREDLLIAATHTHHSPANFSSNLFYNRFAGSHGGFDPILHEFLAHRIAASIALAHKKRRPASVAWRQTFVDGLARNRSFEPFLANAEAQAVLQQNRQLGLQPCPEFAVPPAGHNPDPERCRAVYPQVGLLSAVDSRGQLIADAAFVAVHPTVMPNDINLYHSDLFGVAANRAEQHFDTTSGPVVAIFNGAEGDISPAWLRHDVGETLRLGDKLADAIISAHTTQPRELGSRIDNRMRRVAVAGVTTSSGKTSDRPLPGKGQLGGAEDHRTVWHRRGYHEGVRARRERYPGQGHKQPALPVPLVALGVPKNSLPRQAPVAVHHLGNLVLAGIPGEATTVLGMRLRRQISRVHPTKQVALVGLANEYLAYFTTPQEYALQHYEGASMMFGPHVAEVLLRSVYALATPGFTFPSQAPYRFIHHPGPRRHGALRHGPSQRKRRRTHQRILDVFASKIAALTLDFHARAPQWSLTVTDDPMIPEPFLEQLVDGVWTIHPQNSRGWVVTLQRARPRTWSWRAEWFGQPPPPGQWRVRVKTGPTSKVTVAFTVDRDFQPTTLHIEPEV